MYYATYKKCLLFIIINFYHVAGIENRPSNKRKMPSTKLHAAKKCRIGRPSIESMFPGIVNTARAFVEENGFEAHRRRDTVGKCGTTLANIREHLLDVTPGLAKLNKNIGNYLRRKT